MKSLLVSNHLLKIFPRSTLPAIKTHFSTLNTLHNHSKPNHWSHIVSTQAQRAVDFAQRHHLKDKIIYSAGILWNAGSFVVVKTFRSARDSFVKSKWGRNLPKNAILDSNSSSSTADKLNLRDQFDSFIRKGILSSPKSSKSSSAKTSSTSSDDLDAPLLSELMRGSEEGKVMDVADPRHIVSELDQYIIGQEEAKRAVAISLRNRWRRHQLKEANLRETIIPKNILMIGSTGVGKTEIARQVADISGAPFVKVEATKFATNRWRHGTSKRDSDLFGSKEFGSVVEDLMEVAVDSVKRSMKEKAKDPTSTCC